MLDEMIAVVKRTNKCKIFNRADFDYEMASLCSDIVQVCVLSFRTSTIRGMEENYLSMYLLQMRET